MNINEQPPLGSVGGVLKSRAFLHLWLAQILSQTALNATIYCLLIMVEERTGSSTALGLLILSFIVPSVIIGVAAGVFVDRWQKKTVLITTNLLRALIVATFVVLAQNYLLVLMVNLAYSVVSQFFAPAEIATIPSVVSRKDLIVANGLFNFTVSAAQLAGFVIVGPILTKSLPIEWIFIVLAAMYVICAVLIGLMRFEEPAIERSELDLKTGWAPLLLNELKEGWALLVQDDAISLSVMHLTVMNALILVVGMLAPGYVSRVVGIRTDDSVYIMAPAGIGMLAGISLLPRLARRWPKESIANTGIYVTGCTILLLGIVGQLSDFITQVAGNPNLAGIVLPPKIWLVAIVMLLALLLGFGYAAVNVSAQTLVHERVPADLRGRVFATQFAFANAAAAGPLMFMGSLADLTGINNVAYLGAGIVLAIGGFSTLRTRQLQALRWEQPR